MIILNILLVCIAGLSIRPSLFCTVFEVTLCTVFEVTCFVLTFILFQESVEGVEILVDGGVW